MNSLPYELKLSISESLSAKELLKLCETSSDINELCNDDSVWKKYFMKYYGIYIYDKVLSIISNTMSWYEAFKKYYKLDLHTLLPSIYVFLTESIRANNNTNRWIHYQKASLDYYIGNLYHDDYGINHDDAVFKLSLPPNLLAIIDPKKGPAKANITPIEIIKRWLVQDITRGNWNMYSYKDKGSYLYISEMLAKHQDAYHKDNPFTSCSSKVLDFHLSLISFSHDYDKSNEMFIFIDDTIAKYEIECMNKGEYTLYDNFTVIKGGRKGLIDPSVIDYNIRDIIKSVKLKTCVKYGHNMSYLYIYLIDSEEGPKEVNIREESNGEYYISYLTIYPLQVIYNFEGDIVIATRNNFSVRYFNYFMKRVKGILAKLPPNKSVRRDFTEAYNSIMPSDDKIRSIIAHDLLYERNLLNNTHIPITDMFERNYFNNAPVRVSHNGLYEEFYNPGRIIERRFYGKW